MRSHPRSDRVTSARRLVVLATAAVMLAVLAWALLPAPQASSAQRQAGGAPLAAGSSPARRHAAAVSFSAVLHAPNHRPVMNKPWRITVVVTMGRQKLSGNVNYRFLYPGLGVVGRQPGHKFTGGVFNDTLTFPAASVGKTLTLQVVVTTRYGTRTLSWNITPVK